MDTLVQLVVKIYCCSLSNAAIGRASRQSTACKTAYSNSQTTSLNRFFLPRIRLATDSTGKVPDVGTYTTNPYEGTERSTDRSVDVAQPRILQLRKHHVQPVRVMAAKKFILDLRCSKSEFENQTKGVENLPLQVSLQPGQQQLCAGDVGRNTKAYHWSRVYCPSHTRKLSCRLEAADGDTSAVPSLQTVSNLGTRRFEESIPSLSHRPATKFTVGNFSTKHLAKPETNLSMTMKSLEEPPQHVRGKAYTPHHLEEEESSSED